MVYGAAIAGSFVRVTAGHLLTGDLAARAAARGTTEAPLDVKFRASRDRADAEAIILFGEHCDGVTTPSFDKPPFEI